MANVNLAAQPEGSERGERESANKGLAAAFCCPFCLRPNQPVLWGGGVRGNPGGEALQVA